MLTFALIKTLAANAAGAFSAGFFTACLVTLIVRAVRMATSMIRCSGGFATGFVRIVWFGCKNIKDAADSVYAQRLGELSEIRRHYHRFRTGRQSAFLCAY